MRKKTEDRMRCLLREELCRQAANIAEIITYEQLKAHHVDPETIIINTEDSNCCFTIYLYLGSYDFEVAHYHSEDALWVITNQNKVRSRIDEELVKFLSKE